MKLNNNKKITLATVKSFVRKNQNELFIQCESSFSGMTDMVENYETLEMDRVTETPDFTDRNRLGIPGVWLVGSSRDSFSHWEDDNFEGVRVYNCCGSFVLAVKKTPILTTPEATTPSNVINFFDYVTA